MALEQQLESVNETSSTNPVALEGVDTENLPKLPPASEPETQWQQINRKISQFVDQLPYYLNKFWEAYKLPLITLALVLAAIVTLKVVVAILDAINDIPILEPALELIGIIYSTWFVFRYLLQASTRQEVLAEIRSFKIQTLGEDA
ncbi:CAAD domain-containing protein [Fortiea sp. LEGE XX443]|uniref:CAAD domain-containing protein n=1 Tax=Fortiea sp. LEGE XX443 TaxID=1828611 RepID=UPI0018819F72|nr:CAAD domain-containing protein [Fortiea sp. LEGE XX443]MBE9007396.1 CAAD domain-containing protein [Fortiea sp. LEGE XX443]